MSSTFSIAGSSTTSAQTILGVFSRASTATYFDSTGTMQIAGIDQPRLNYAAPSYTVGSIMSETTSTNVLRNPLGEGSVAGTSLVSPTDWSMVVASGITTTLLATGQVENGIPCTDFSFTGTPTATALSIQVGISNQYLASAGQVWSASAYIKLLSGSNPSGFVQLVILNTNGSTNAFGSTFVPTTAALNTQYMANNNATLTTGTTAVSLLIRFNVTIGTPVTFSARIGLPQLERQSTSSSSMIPPSGGLTNYLFPSVSGYSANWGIAGTGVLTNNQLLAPDGTTSGAMVAADAPTNAHALFLLHPVPLLGSVYTVSVYAHSGVSSRVQVEYRTSAWTGSGAANPSGTFNLSTGTVTSTTGNAVCTINSDANGWYRLTVTTPGGATASGAFNIFFYVLSITGVQSYSGTTNGENVYYWGAQSERASSVGTYIPSTLGLGFSNAAQVRATEYTGIATSLALTGSATTSQVGNSINQASSTIVGSSALTPVETIERQVLASILGSMTLSPVDYGYAPLTTSIFGSTSLTPVDYGSVPSSSAITGSTAFSVADFCYIQSASAITCSTTINPVEQSPALTSTAIVGSSTLNPVDQAVFASTSTIAGASALTWADYASATGSMSISGSTAVSLSDYASVPSSFNVVASGSFSPAYFTTTYSSGSLAGNTFLTYSGITIALTSTSISGSAATNCNGLTLTISSPNESKQIAYILAENRAAVILNEPRTVVIPFENRLMIAAISS